MKIISIVLIGIAFVISMQASAQKALNIELGINSANRYVNARTMKPFSNYTFGLSWDTPINDNLFVRIGAGFAQDSKKIYEDQSWGVSQKSFTISNFDLPVTVGYKKEVGSFIVSAQGGLFWSKHLSGNLYSKIIDYRAETERYENIWFGKDNRDWRRSDLGFIVKAGAEYKNFELAVGFAMGLIDQTHASDVIYRPMQAWSNATTHQDYDYGVTPEALKRLTISLSYRFELEDVAPKIGE